MIVDFRRERLNQQHELRIRRTPVAIGVQPADHLSHDPKRSLAQIDSLDIIQIRGSA